jgi:hypothetical protein
MQGKRSGFTVHGSKVYKDVRIERGKHMSYPPKFEDVEAWQLARGLTRKANGKKVTLNP